MNSVNVELLNHQIYTAAFNKIQASRNMSTVGIGGRLNNWRGKLIILQQKEQENNASPFTYVYQKNYITSQALHFLFYKISKVAREGNFVHFQRPKFLRGALQVTHLLMKRQEKRNIYLKFCILFRAVIFYDSIVSIIQDRVSFLRPFPPKSQTSLSAHDCCPGRRPQVVTSHSLTPCNNSDLFSLYAGSQMC